MIIILCILVFLLVLVGGHLFGLWVSTLPMFFVSWFVFDLLVFLILGDGFFVGGVDGLLCVMFSVLLAVYYIAIFYGNALVGRSVVSGLVGFNDVLRSNINNGFRYKFYSYVMILCYVYSFVFFAVALLFGRRI